MQVTQIRKENLISKPSDYFPKSKEVGRGANKKPISLYSVLSSGQRVIFYKDEPDELKSLNMEEIGKRLYRISVLFDKEIGRIKFQYHLEARNDKELQEAFPPETFGQSGKNGFSSFDWDFIRPRLLLSLGNFNFVVEGKDFEILPDGEILLKF